MDNSLRLIQSPSTNTPGKITNTSSNFSNTIRARKRSRTSSTDDDNSESNQKQPKNSHDSHLKSSARPSTWRTRLQLEKDKGSPKYSRNRRGGKPKLGGLKNAVVLAPFYTLKKSFQNKLLNFYSLEKVKKNNHKKKISKNQKKVFEYDIIELKPKRYNIKREKKTNKNSKQNSKSVRNRSKKNKEKTVKNQHRKNLKVKRKTSEKSLSNSRAKNFSKKKRNDTAVIPTILNSELSPNFFVPKCESLTPGPYRSSSAHSARSESLSDSWETFSNSPSKEEYVEGALAISTSSFDCYLENLDREDWDLTEEDKKSTKTSRPTENFSQKPYLSSSKHTIFERKNSDTHIIDFTDREPKIRHVSSEESQEHLRPLQLKSRTKTKKPESDPGHSYHIQSLSSESGKNPRCSSRISDQIEHQKSTFCESNKCEILQVEVATQVEVKETNNVVQELSETFLQNNSQVPNCDTNSGNVNVVRQKTLKEPSCGPNSSFPLPKDETADEKNLINLSGIVPNKSDPSDTEIQPTETEENSDSEFPILGARSGIHKERPISAGP